MPLTKAFVEFFFIGVGIALFAVAPVAGTIVVVGVIVFEYVKYQRRHSLATASSPQAPGTSIPEGRAGSEAIANLERLSALHLSGQLTDSEFEAEKARILDR